MLSRRRIRPAPGRCPAGGQAHVEAPTRVVAHIADGPVMAPAFAVRQIGSAHRLGMPAQFGREVASRVDRTHDDAPEDAVECQAAAEGVAGATDAAVSGGRPR